MNPFDIMPILHSPLSSPFSSFLLSSFLYSPLSGTAENSNFKNQSRTSKTRNKISKQNTKTTKRREGTDVVAWTKPLRK